MYYQQAWHLCRVASLFLWLWCKHNLGRWCWWSPAVEASLSVLVFLSLIPQTSLVIILRGEKIAVWFYKQFFYDPWNICWCWSWFWVMEKYLFLWDFCKNFIVGMQEVSEPLIYFNSCQIAETEKRTDTSPLSNIILWIFSWTYASHHLELLE